MKGQALLASRAIAKGDHGVALDALLTAWRARRHARLATLIDVVNALALPSVDPLGGDSAPARAKRWIARAKSPSVLDIGALMATLTEGVPVGVIEGRIAILAGFEADPRIAARYVDMLRAPPFTASSHKPVWTEVFRQLREVHDDPRSADALAGLAHDYTRIFGDTVMGRWMQSQLERLASALEKRFPQDHSARATIDGAEAEAIAALEAAVSAVTPSKAVRVTAADDESALLERIAEAPFDLDRREAHRAWLEARKDPRAEFISLQLKRHREGALSAEESSREEALLKAHLKAWLGPLAPITSGHRFERGYLVECMLTPSGTKTGPAIGDPRWATVETLCCTYKKNYGRELILHPVMRSLRRLVDAPTELAGLLLEDPTPHDIESIDCMYGILPKALPATLTAPGLMRLSEFAISCWLNDPSVTKYTSTWQPPDVFAPFLQSPLAARLAVLRWNVHDSFVGDALTTLEAHAPKGFTARVDLFHCALSRGPDGSWSLVEVDLASADHELQYMKSKLRTVRRLSPERIAKVTVRAPPGVDISSLATEIEAVRAHFVKAEVTLSAK